VALCTLKKRSEFLRLRGGARFATACFVLETRPREDANGGSEIREPRFGFTVTKKLGGAVVRNRIRRRLKAALGLVAGSLARPDHDYVLVARLAALDRDFEALKKDLERALHRVHHAPAAEKSGGR
jgi:ribonuclease P protein component